MTGAKRDRVLMILSFLAIHIVWGSTYLAVRYTVETIPPLLAAGIRHLCGGGVLFLWCWWRGLRPTREEWRASLVLSVMFFLIGHGTLFWAEMYVPSGIAALLISAEPLWVAGLATLAGHRSRPSAAAIAGLIIGIAAVALLVGRPTTLGTKEFLGSIALVLSGFSWSVGIIYSKNARLHPNPMMSSAMTLLSGGTLLALTSVLTGSATNLDVTAISARSVISLAYLIVFGAATFAGYTWLLTRVSPVLVATHAYTNPLIAVILGGALAGEAITPRVAVSAIAIVLSILLVKSDRPTEPVALQRPLASEETPRQSVRVRGSRQ